MSIMKVAANIPDPFGLTDRSTVRIRRGTTGAFLRVLPLILFIHFCDDLVYRLIIQFLTIVFIVLTLIVIVI